MDGERTPTARESLADAPPAPPPPDGDPTPDERADFVVRRLAQFIRDGRTIDEGMSLKQWQDLARAEIALAIAAAEAARRGGEVVTRRLLFTTGAALVTLGFWGTAIAYDKASGLAAGIICFAAGAILIAVAGEWRIRRAVARHYARKRAEAVGRIEDLTRRIRRMEKELEDEAERLEERVEAKAREKAVRDELQETMRRMRDKIGR